MISDLLRRLTTPEPDPMPDEDARLALAALLVRLARADGRYSDDEVARIDRVLASRYDLGPFEASRLRGEAEAVEGQAPDTVRFTRAIKDGVPYEEREGVIAAMWEIVLADGQRDSEEDALLRLVAPLLGVSDQDSAMIRQRIEARRDGIAE